MAYLQRAVLKNDVDAAALLGGHHLSLCQDGIAAGERSKAAADYERAVNYFAIAAKAGHRESRFV